MPFFLDILSFLAILTDMRKKDTKISRLRELAQRVGILHARELTPLGIPHRYFGRLCADGFLVKISHGLYMISGGPETAHLGLVQAAKAIPKSVICLLSALHFHEIGTQVPHQIWVAMDRRAARPRMAHLKIQVVRFSGKSLTEGIAEHDIAGTRVRIYNPAKTVADCFKYRNKIGLDIAIEALREAVRGRKCTVDDLWRYANICRVSKVMLPYMEAML
ncbi:MAG: type IV toxin-antitoxin system AbiEi family antitoxin domain-containing protein [Planctomycetota bacterium]